MRRPARWCARAGPRIPTAPRSIRRAGGTRWSGHRRGRRPRRRRGRLGGRAAARHGLPRLARRGGAARRCCGTTPARPGPPRTWSRELGDGDAGRGGQAWADAVGSVPLASFTVTKLRWLARHEPESMRRTAAVCLPHDWLTWQLRRPAGGLDGLRTDRGDASGTGYWSPAEGRYRPDLLARAAGKRAGRARACWRRPSRPGRSPPTRAAPYSAPVQATTRQPPRGRAGRRRRGGVARHLRHGLRRELCSRRATARASSPASPMPPGTSCRWSAP